MKNVSNILLFFVALLVTSCASPKVELFQRKVKPVPQMTARAVELQRQAALAAAEKAEQVAQIVIQEQCEPAIEPAQQVQQLTQVVSDSVGQPVDTPNIDTLQDVQRLVEQLRSELGRLQRRLDVYRDAVQRDVGKEIEGTGLIQVSYFQLAVIGFVAILILTVLWRAFGVALAATNPVVGFGVKTAAVGARFANRALAQIIRGGEQFIKELDEVVPDEQLKQKIIERFKVAHKQAQDQDVQQFIRNIK